MLSKPTIEIQKRRSLSPAEKAKVIDRQKGVCGCGCKERLAVGLIDFDHEIDLQFGGSNDLSNFVALIRKHHMQKTATNATRRAKADRQRAKNDGSWLSAKDRELARIMSKTRQAS
jgi:predicted NAD/FAD-dependent oxidoreductase